MLTHLAIYAVQSLELANTQRQKLPDHVRLTLICLGS
jgi:hypothetical protein